MNQIQYQQIFNNFYIDQKWLSDSLSFSGANHDYIHVKEVGEGFYCWVDKIPEVDQSIQKFVHRLNQERSSIADFTLSFCLNENLLKLKQKIKQNNQQPLTFLRRFSRLVYNIYCLFYHRINRFGGRSYEELQDLTEERIKQSIQKMDSANLVQVIGAYLEEMCRDYDNICSDNKEFIGKILKTICSNTDDKICQYAFNFIEKLKPEHLQFLVRILQEQENGNLFIARMIQLVIFTLYPKYIKLQKFCMSDQEVRDKLSQILSSIQTENIRIIIEKRFYIRGSVSDFDPFNPFLCWLRQPFEFPILLINYLLLLDLLPTDLENWLDIVLSHFSKEDNFRAEILKDKTLWKDSPEIRIKKMIINHIIK